MEYPGIADADLASGVGSSPKDTVVESAPIRRSHDPQSFVSNISAPDQSLQMSLAAKAARSVGFLRRSAGTSVGRLHRARRMKVRGDLALLCAAPQDAAKYAAAAAIELKAVDDVQWQASALVTWIAATQFLSDTAVLRDCLTCSPVVVPRTDIMENAMLSPSPVSQVKTKVEHNTDECSHFTTDELDFRGHQNEECGKAVQTWTLRIIKAASDEALRGLRRKSSLASLAIELGLKLARMYAVVGDKRSVVNSVESTRVLMEDGAVSPFELARTSQAVSLICQHVGLRRKAALYSTRSTHALRDLCSFACAQLCARLAMHCTNIYGWTRVSKLAASDAASVAKLRGDLDLAASASVTLMRYHAKLSKYSQLHDERPNFSIDATGPTTKLLSLQIPDGNSGSTTEDQQRVVLEETEVFSAELPDDAPWDQVDPTSACMIAFRHHAPYSHGCMDSALVRGHACNSDVPYGASSVPSDGPQQEPPAHPPFLWSPFERRPLQDEPSSHSAAWSVGERVAVVVRLKNVLLAPLYVHSARLVCVGGRHICHEVFSFPNQLHNPQLIDADSNSALELHVTPLEAGTLQINGLQLRTSLYMTTNTVLLKQAYCAVKYVRGHVELRDVEAQESLEASRCRIHGTRNDADIHCEASLCVFSPRPNFLARVKYVPYCEKVLRPSTRKSCQNAQRICRPGERIMLALIITNSTTVTPTDIDFRATCNNGRLTQMLFTLRESLINQQGPRT